MNENLHEGHRARIRAAYREHGTDGMADHELLELLLTYAVPRIDVNPLAHRLLNSFGSLNGVLKAAPRELMRIQGVGEQTATFLHVLFDVHQRLTLQSMQSAAGPVRLGTPQEACRYALALSSADSYETLRMISLDASMAVIHTDVLAAGTPTKVDFEPRRVIETALLHKARYVILAHNHPTGIPVPSEEDVETAKMIQEIATKLEIDVRDQLILANNAVYSLQYGKVFLFSGPAICHTMTLDQYADTIDAARKYSRLS